MTPTSRRRAYEALVGYLKEQRVHENDNVSDSAQESTHSHEATASLIDNVCMLSFVISRLLYLLSLLFKQEMRLRRYFYLQIIVIFK